MADVFISYHEKSSGDIAKQIAEALNDVGVSCWYAEKDMPTGADFARVIPEEINRCKIFLLILDDGATQSRHVESELGLAFGGDRTVMPYQVEQCALPGWMRYYLGHAQIERNAFKLVNQVMCALWDESHIERGKCGKNVRWALNDRLELSIAGSGPMSNYVYGDAQPHINSPWYSQHGNILSVRISPGVTSIANRAFMWFVSLRHVSIPDGVTHIGDSAFFECYALKDIEIPDSVVSIGDYGFGECTNLTSFTIPDGVIRIGDYAFEGCKRLASVSIPKSVQKIGSRAFYKCEKLEGVRIGTNTEIAPDTFDDTTKITRY